MELESNKQIVGRCSICGGDVETYVFWMGVTPPPVTCRKCGATKDDTAHLPVVPMIPNNQSMITVSSSTDNSSPYYKRQP